MSLYSVYLFTGKPGTAGERLKRATKDPKLGICGSWNTPWRSHNYGNVSQDRVKIAGL